LGQNRTDVQFYGRNPQGNLHNQCDRIIEYELTENHQNQRQFPVGRSVPEIIVFRVEKCVEKVDNANSELGFSNESIRHHV
jgi:hypothetical protein